MSCSLTERRRFLAGAGALCASSLALAHRSKQEARLPQIGPAPDFTLTD